MEKRICTKCNEEKTIDNFRYRKDTRYKNGGHYVTYCKNCESLIANKWNKQHPELCKKYNEKTKHSEKRKQWIENYKEKQNELNRKRRKKPEEKLKSQARCLLYHSFKRAKTEKCYKSKEILGCDINFFVKYLLQTYKDIYGEDWDNKQIVHIDHIIPLANANTEEEVIRLCHYTNLQLLKAEDNMKKHTKKQFII